MSKINAQEAQALYLADIERCWRAWRDFITEKRDEQQQRATADDDIALVQPVGGGARIRQARLDGPTRATLGAALEARRQYAQQEAEAEVLRQNMAAPIPDQVYAALLEQIWGELHGQVHSEGWALVWYNDQLIEFDYQTVGSMATDEDYHLMGAADLRRQQRRPLLIGGGVVIALLLLLLLRLQPWATPGEAAEAPRRTAFVETQAVPFWDVQTLAVDAQAPLTQGVLGYPLIACLAPEQRAALQPEGAVVLTGTTSVRHYRLHAQITDTPRDLLLADCRGPQRPRMLQAAQLVETHTSRTLDPGVLLAVAVQGADSDPDTIPQDRMLVALTMQTTESGTLILADGSRWSPTRTQPQEDESMLLEYLVPAASAIQRAGWEQRDPAGGLPALLAFDLPAPTPRQTTLRQAISVQAGPAQVTTTTITLPLTITMHAAAAPLTVQPSDLVATDRTGRTVSIDWEPPTWQPGRAATVTLTLDPTRMALPLDLALADWHARLEAAP